MKDSLRRGPKSILDLKPPKSMHQEGCTQGFFLHERGDRIIWQDLEPILDDAVELWQEQECTSVLAATKSRSAPEALQPPNTYSPPSAYARPVPPRGLGGVPETAAAPRDRLAHVLVEVSKLYRSLKAPGAGTLMA